MKYLEWNHLISNYFFNPSKAGKDVLLYITKQEVSELGMNFFGFSNPEDTWADYCKALRTGFPEIQNKQLFVDKFNVVNDKWIQYEKWVFQQKNENDLKIEGISIRNSNGIVPPFYIGFLIALIIPLTDNPDHHRANAYYPRLKEFLKENNIALPEVKTLNFSLDVWENLEKWSRHYYQTDIGIFEKRNFGSEKWIYVGKPFSQCILSPKNLRNIPSLFWAAELSPDTLLTEVEILNILKLYGQKELGLSKKLIDGLQDRNDEIGKVVVDIIKREYEKWEGDVYEYDTDDENESSYIKSGWVSAILYSSFTVDTVNDEWEHQYFIYSKNEYPEDLYLLGQSIYPLANGYSKPVNLSFNQELIGEDRENKWKVAPNKGDLILYRNGAYAGLSNDVWIETSEMSRASQMYLLCKSTKEGSIDEWGQHFTPGNFKKETNLNGIPNGYILYRFKHPTIEHPNEVVLKFQATKKIELSGGLKINNREYLKDAPPTVYLRGGTGIEKVYIKYIDADELEYLKNNPLVPEEYILPDSIRHDTDFLIQVEGEELTGYTIPYKIVEANINRFLLNENNLPRRNKYGELSKGNDSTYILGSNTIYNRWTYQQGWIIDFFSVNYEGSGFFNQSPDIKHEDGNLLLEYLTCLKETGYEHFSAAFDYLSAKTNLWRKTDENTKWIKQVSIKFYDFLGYLDYEYSTGKITINKPQIIIIPSNKNVEAILIGARTRNNLSQLIRVAHKLHIKVEVKAQEDQLCKYLLPDTLYLIPAECKNSTEAISKLDKLAAELEIIFKKVERPEIKPAIVQFGLQDFSADISEYKQHILYNNLVEEKDYSWARRVFNISTLKFEKFDGELNTNLTLVMYVLKYQKFYRFWYNGKCYNVDENWGTYLIASELNRKVIYYSREQKILAVPKNMLLPRLISESLMLLSGRAPSFKALEMNGNKIVYQLYQNVPKLFAENLFRKFNQEIQPINL